MDAKALERGLDLLPHARHGVAVVLGQLGDVVPEVAALRRLLAAATRLDGLAELVHLGAGVVVVVLARHVVPRVLEEPRHRIAVRPVPCRGDRDRPGRVRRDHLDLHPLGLVRETRSVAIARVEDLAQRFPVPGRREPEVDEARAGDLGALDALQRLCLGDQLFRDLARRLLALGSELERSVRRVVPVIAARRPLELDAELALQARERLSRQRLRVARRGLRASGALRRCRRRSSRRPPRALLRDPGSCRTCRRACATR